MINWDLITKDFNLMGRYGHFLVISSSGRFLDLVFYHYDNFDYVPYCPSLDSFSFISRNYVVDYVQMKCNFDNFHCVIILSKYNYLSRFLKSSKYQLDVHK